MERVSRRRRGYAEEGKDFWEKHLLGFRESGLKKASYCRANGINYYRFIYWGKVLSDKRSKGSGPKEASMEEKLKVLLPVEIKRDVVERNTTERRLCSLECRNGIILRIHEEVALEFILGRMC
jgi:hypothetical protein